MTTREHSTVIYINFDDHTSSFYIDTDNGHGKGQAFISPVLNTPEAIAHWKSAIADLFGVRFFDEIIGCECFVLRCWADEDIEGLEVDGKRLTLTAFCRNHWPAKSRDPLESKLQSIRGDIASCTRRIEERCKELITAREGYHDWNVESVFRVRDIIEWADPALNHVWHGEVVSFAGSTMIVRWLERSAYPGRAGSFDLSQPHHHLHIHKRAES